MVLGEDGVYGTIGLPEVVIGGSNAPVTSEEASTAKAKNWFRNNWYLVVMPLSVIALIFLWKKYGHKIKFNKKK